MQILNRARFLAAAGGLLWLFQPQGLAGTAQAQVLVPGTGMRAEKIGDDFEDEKWAYVANNPKSSHEQDEQIRTPAGQSTNGRWSESAKRGHPDLIERVATPPGGLPGSRGALKLRTSRSGVPGSISGQNEQDDLICNVRGGPYSVASGPSVVVRVALPPFEQWEQRQGNSFGVRLSVEGYRPNDGKRDTYWPGMFIYYYPAATVRGKDGKPQQREAYAQLIVRAGPVGQDMWGPKMTEPGWWTLGMSCSADGMIHYFAHAGVDDLTREDLISSQSPYGFQAERLQSFFFDLVNRDDGQNWSTTWIIDDPRLYFAQRPIHSPNLGTSGGKEEGGGFGLFGRRRR
ncbi:MAG TPA: hypothetical protein VHY91_27495 [Pirellulales bacterium]|nr:hypothetical protein [Pirellulales bacterium]